MNRLTTSQQHFGAKRAESVPPVIIRHNNLGPGSGRVPIMSQSQRDYQPKFSEQVKPVRVHDNLGFSNAKMRSASSNQGAYQPKLVDRVASIKVRDNIGFSSAKMQGTTTSQRSFAPKLFNVVTPIVTRDNLSTGSGRMFQLSVAQSDYQPKIADAVRPVKVTENLGSSVDKMQNTTAISSDYRSSLVSGAALVKQQDSLGVSSPKTEREITNREERLPKVFATVDQKDNLSREGESVSELSQSQIQSPPCLVEKAASDHFDQSVNDLNSKKSAFSGQESEGEKCSRSGGDYYTKAIKWPTPVRYRDNLGFSGKMDFSSPTNNSYYQSPVATRATPAKYSDNLGFSGPSQSMYSTNQQYFGEKIELSGDVKWRSHSRDAVKKVQMRCPSAG